MNYNNIVNPYSNNKFFLLSKQGQKLFYKYIKKYKQKGSGSQRLRWYKGNVHTHTLFSDGQIHPIYVIEEYIRKGYNFLVLSEHSKSGTYSGMNKIYRCSNPKHVTRQPPNKPCNCSRLIELPTYDTLKKNFKKDIELIPGEEITGNYTDERDVSRPIHITTFGINKITNPEFLLNRKIPTSVSIRKTLNLVSPKNKTIAVINHPNYYFAPITPDVLAEVKEIRFMEICNCSHNVYINGNPNHGRAKLSYEDKWDIANFLRLVKYNYPLIYGIAADDSHVLKHIGCGWVCVYSESPKTSDIVKNMKMGKYYCSTGVTLRKITFFSNTLSVYAKSDNKYTSFLFEFIVSKRNGTIEKVLLDNGMTQYKTKKIGIKVASKVRKGKASYRCKEDDLYVRCVVWKISYNPKTGKNIICYNKKKDWENKAWTCPFKVL